MGEDVLSQDEVESLLRTIELQQAKPSTRAKSPGPVQALQVQIAARAHELYVQRGCLDGYHLHDWLQAEREILGNAADSDKSAARI